MKALSSWKAVTQDKSHLLDDVFALLQDNGVRFCVIGGQAVNAYVEPLVSLDLDLVGRGRSNRSGPQADERPLSSGGVSS